MTEERLGAFAEAWNEGDLDRVMSFFTDDCTYKASFGPELDGTTFEGRDAVRAGVRAFMETFPDGKYSDLDALIVGDRAATQWTFRGTRDSGEVVTYRGADFYEFEGDSIKSKDAFRKELSAPLSTTARS